MPNNEGSTIREAFNAAVRSHSQGKLAEAEILYRQVLVRDGNHVPAQYNLMRLAYQTGRLEIALSLAHRLVNLEPGNPWAHFNLGNILGALARRTEAISAYAKAISLNVNFLEAYNNLGNILVADRRLDEAMTAFESALRLNPNNRETNYNYASALHEIGRHDEAILACRVALRVDPGLANAHDLLGMIFREKGLLADAVRAHRQAIGLRPDFAEAHSNLAVALLRCDRVDEALDAARRSIELKPHSAIGQHNLATILAAAGQIEHAIEGFRRAIALDPGFAKPHYSLSMLLLSKGAFKEGFEEYEWRRAIPWFRVREDLSAPRWSGQDLAGKTLLLYNDGGLGDAMQFIRYAPLLVSRGANVLFRCAVDLIPLLKLSDGISSFIEDGAPDPGCDFQLPLQSLPRALGTTVQKIPCTIPYLSAPAELTRDWANRLASDSRLKVGLVWASSARRDERSCRLTVLAPLAAATDVTFYSLQKGPEAAQAAPSGLRIIDLSNELHDFAQTAAVVMNLDLVISADTSVAHLAGGLGTPIWVLVPHLPDWRWLLDREDSPWYPTMRLFRQKKSGDWDDVAIRITNALNELVRRRRNSSR